MLLDIKKLHAVQDARDTEPNYATSDYERDKSVFVFRITCEDEEQGDIINYADALYFVATFEDASPDEQAVAEARELLNSGHTLRIGPDEDWYRIIPLPEPMTHNRFGELVPLTDLEQSDQDFEPPFDCRAGFDFPASL